MSHLQLDGDTLGRLLARAGVTVSVDGRGVALGGAGWEAVVERLQVEATVRGAALDSHGWVADLGALDRALKAAAEALDHGLLNDKPGLEQPTLEHLCLWLVERLKPEWPGLSRITVARPTIHERCTLTL